MHLRQLIYQDFASLWQLQHSNIAMFKGLYYPDGEEDGPPAMVVRREKHTSVFVYLREHTSTRNTLQIVISLSVPLISLFLRVGSRFRAFPMAYGIYTPGCLRSFMATFIQCVWDVAQRDKI